MSELRAYTTTITKKDFVAELEKHQKADDFIRGSYWSKSSGKGCAVGCSLESISRLKNLDFTDFSDHSLYPVHLGIPEWLARVEDTLFEGMSKERSKTWPVDFAKAIPEGADLEPVKTKFVVMLLEHTLGSMEAAKYDAEKWPNVKAAIEGSKAAVKQMIDAQQSGDPQKISAAESAAWSAAESAAWSAAESAALSARSAESAAYDYYSDQLLELLRDSG